MHTSATTVGRDRLSAQPPDAGRGVSVSQRQRWAMVLRRWTPGRLALGLWALGVGLVLPPAHALTPQGLAPGYEAPATDRSCPGALSDAGLGLAEALQRALCSHPATRQSWAALSAAGAEQAWFAAPRRPSAQASIGAGQLRSSERLPDEPSDRNRGGWTSASVSVDWVLFDFGERAAQGLAVAAALEAAQASHQEAIHSVMLEAAEAWHALAEAQALHHLLRESERYNRELLQLSLRPRGRSRTQLEPLDERLARTSLSARALELRRSQAELARARGRLAVLLGLSPNDPLPLAPWVVQPSDADFEPGLDSLMDEAMARHPTLRIARARISEAQAELEVAHRQHRPQLRAGASLQRDQDRSSGLYAERRAGLSLDIPLFAGADRQREVRQAQARLEQARAAAEQARRDRSTEVWVHYQDVREEVAALRLGQRWHEEAQALLTAEMKAFAREDADMFDVLDAYDTVMEARNAQASAHIALSLARFKLASAMGRLSAPPPSGR